MGVPEQCRLVAAEDMGIGGVTTLAGYFVGDVAGEHRDRATRIRRSQPEGLGRRVS
jgi:hypothetical protein